jgi:hypothetical protein
VEALASRSINDGIPSLNFTLLQFFKIKFHRLSLAEAKVVIITAEC